MWETEGEKLCVRVLARKMPHWRGKHKTRALLLSRRFPDGGTHRQHHPDGEQSICTASSSVVTLTMSRRRQGWPQPEFRRPVTSILCSGQRDDRQDWWKSWRCRGVSPHPTPKCLLFLGTFNSFSNIPERMNAV